MQWQEFSWQQEDPDPKRERLCARSHAATELDCRIEGANLTREEAALKDEIALCSYNLQRGLRLDEQLRAFGGRGGIPSPDVLLLPARPTAALAQRP